MSKEKLESDYQNFNKEIEQLSKEAIKNIREKASAVKQDAKKIGEMVSSSIDERDAKKP